MKNFFILVAVQVKRLIKNKDILIGFIAPFVLMLIVFIITVNLGKIKEKDKETVKNDFSVRIDNIGYTVNDKADLWKKFIKGGVLFEDMAKAKDGLAKSEIIGLIIIPDDFSEKINRRIKPELEILTNDNTGMNSIVQLINININNYLIDSFIRSSNIAKDTSKISASLMNVICRRSNNVGIINIVLKMITLMILYVICISSASILKDIVTFRESKMLARAISSPNSERAIVGSILCAFVFLQVTINMIFFFIFVKTVNLKIAGLGIIFLTVISAGFFSLSLAVLFARIFKKVSQLNTASGLILIITMILFFLALSFTMDDIGIISVPVILKRLTPLSPLYWLVEMLDKEKLFPNLIIVWLMIAAIFTSGSWKLKEFNA
ncbi:ABC transporter permease [Treponema pedis]|uniref:ABC-2 type transporter transmembrane domain-containing protein n=2 Tax=Treponema pedis TaxID=409322 RepID=S6A229_9SPIR|nr:ABC transporter permease [Treponema pedis]AGT45048.1 hypothetical protein TPE_2576 [Treponema pedis str. T A4]